MANKYFQTELAERYAVDPNRSSEFLHTIQEIAGACRDDVDAAYEALDELTCSTKQFPEAQDCAKRLLATRLLQRRADTAAMVIALQIEDDAEYCRVFVAALAMGRPSAELKVVADKAATDVWGGRRLSGKNSGQLGMLDLVK